jgi:hypothetical protein
MFQKGVQSLTQSGWLGAYITTKTLNSYILKSLINIHFQNSSMSHKTYYKCIFLSDFMENDILWDFYANKQGKLPVYGTVFVYIGGLYDSQATNRSAGSSRTESALSSIGRLGDI